MSRKFLIALVALIVVAFAGYCIWSGAIKQNLISPPTSLDKDTSINRVAITTQVTDSSSLQTVQQVAEKRIVTSSDWKTYTNTNLGFAFQYPSVWVKDGQETQAIDRSGNVIEIDVNFIDTVTQTSLLIAFHMPPGGNQLYDYAVSRLANNHSDNIKQIIVAGTKAIQVESTVHSNGKGDSIKSINTIVVDFLSSKLKGGIEIQFNTPMPAEVEVVKFNQLLSTFKFTS